MEIHVPPRAAAALEALEKAGFESWVVGGCVRDALLGREPHDWDIATAAVPAEGMAVFAGERVIETGLRHGTFTLLTPEGPLEITTFRTEGDYSDRRHPDAVTFVRDIREDLSRRDFTVNAMAYSPRRGLRDDFGGREDLERGIIRCVGDPDARLGEDALRILRALRFAARYGFSVEAETAAALRRNQELLNRISPERVFAELRGLVCGAGAGEVLLAFPEVIFAVLPELAPMEGFDQGMPENHQYDVWGHTAHALDLIEPDPVLRLVMLFHDGGKPERFTRDAAGRAHFHGHPERGAEIADAALRRLRCDNLTRQTVVTLVRWHDFRSEGSRRALRRLLARIGPENMARLRAVRTADAGAHTPAARDRMLARVREDDVLLGEILSEGTCLTVKDLAVGGKDLDMDPGPAVGAVLRRLLDEVLDETLPNEREALLRRAETLRKELL